VLLVSTAAVVGGLAIRLAMAADVGFTGLMRGAAVPALEIIFVVAVISAVLIAWRFAASGDSWPMPEIEGWTFAGPLFKGELDSEPEPFDLNEFFEKLGTFGKADEDDDEHP